MGLMGLMGTVISGCSDFLDIEPLNEIVLEKFWNEKADVDGIIAGCYSGMQDDAIVRRMIIWGEARSENLAAGLNSTNDENLMNGFKMAVEAGLCTQEQLDAILEEALD